MKYGLLSHNVDLIHVSNITAKIMGHRSAIMHGMWTVARGISELTPLNYPFEIKVKFLVPIYMPAKVVFQKTQDGFGVYSTDGAKNHLLAHVLSK
jgi:acyl dehydratase